MFAFRRRICYTEYYNAGEPPVHPFYPGLQLPAKEDKTMKILKALLAVFTFLAAALTCALLFVQDKHAPRYIQIYTGEHD